MVEIPRSTAIVRTPPEESDEPDAPLMGSEKAPVEHELLIVKSKPLTAKFRTIIKHLRQRAGRLSRFRGLHIFLGYNILFQVLTATLVRLFPMGFLFRSLAHLLVSVGLCRIALLWNHVVISDPSPMSWYSRIVPRKMGHKVIIPAALFALAEQAVIFVPSMVARCLHVISFLRSPQHSFGGVAHMSESQKTWALAKLGLVGLTGMICFVVIYIPAHIALTRVQASLLSEEDESIVPMDRTFGGQVQSAVMAGRGAFAMRAAWKSFDWNSRVRVFKVYAKIFLMQLMLGILYVFVVVFELRLVVGSKKFDEKVMALTLQRGN